MYTQSHSHINTSTGIGVVYSLYDGSGTNGTGSGVDVGETGTQPNTANPFKKNIIDILQSKNIPSFISLSSLLGYLSNQEDKLHAIACGMIQACAKIYEQCTHGSSASAAEETTSIRIVLVKMLHSFSILSKGRQALFDEIGVQKCLSFVQDPSEAVRVEAAKFIASLCAFPEQKLHIKKDRTILLAVVKVFLEDGSQQVTDACIPALQQLTNLDPLLDELTLTKLGQVIVRTSSQGQSKQGGEDRVALALLKTTLQVVWNCSLHSAEKALAISVGLVEKIVPLLENDRDLETIRCASGVLASLAIDQNGKHAIIAQPGAIAQACKLTLDKRSAAKSQLAQAVRTNSVALIRNLTESPSGLAAVGAFLLPEPEVLLEVLGPVSVSSVLAPRLAAVAGEQPDGSDPISVPDAMYTLRATHSLLKSGPEGHEATWRILDVVPRLYKAALFPLPPSANQSTQETVASIRQTAQRCILLLCQENDDARLELLALSQRIGPEATKAVEAFAAVEGSHLKVRQARLALEAQQREEAQAAALAAAQAKAAQEAEAAAALEVARQEQEKRDLEEAEAQVATNEETTAPNGEVASNGTDANAKTIEP